LDKKRKILLMFQNDHNKTEIAKEVGVSRKTVRKYINEFEERLSELDSVSKYNPEKLTELIEALSVPPKYDTSSRRTSKLTDEIKSVIDEYIIENEKKVANRNRKQVMKAIDIYDLLTEKNYDIGYTTVCNYIRSQKKNHEAYIKQIYPKGNTVEFDWGEVKLEIAGEEKKFQMSLFTTANGSCHFARLYPNQKTESFLDSHIKGFKYFGGVHKEVVYDNMKVAVRRFIGKGEKEATEELIKISMYYGFDYRFCNARRGNEKGHVERGIEFVRRKAFARKFKFETLQEANTHLLETANKLNHKARKWLDGKSPMTILTEEQNYLVPLKPDYVIAKKVECRVDKYSTITIEQNRYSVPEYLVGKFLDVTIYPEQIKARYKNEIVASHIRSFDFASWVIDIEHYLNTIKKKPGSLKNSAAIQCSDHRIQKLYYDYYTKNPREFIVLLEIIRANNLEIVENAIVELELIGKRHVTTENIKNIVNQTPIKKDESLNEKDDEIMNRSLEMLNVLTDAFLSSANGRQLN